MSPKNPVLMICLPCHARIAACNDFVSRLSRPVSDYLRRNWFRSRRWLEKVMSKPTKETDHDRPQQDRRKLHRRLERERCRAGARPCSRRPSPRSVSYRDPMMQGDGHDGVAALIDGVQQRFAGFRFSLKGQPDGFEDHIRFSWDLGPEGTAIRHRRHRHRRHRERPAEERHRLPRQGAGAVGRRWKRIQSRRDSLDGRIERAVALVGSRIGVAELRSGSMVSAVAGAVQTASGSASSAAIRPSRAAPKAAPKSPSAGMSTGMPSAVAIAFSQ